MAGRTNRRRQVKYMLRASHGGHARAATLTPEERSAIARKAAVARWQGRADREPTRLEFPELSDVLFVDLGDQLRVQFVDGALWDIWNEADVETAIALLRQWRRKQRKAHRAARSGARVG